MRVSIRVPATSANLGPGFDCFGLALDLCNEVTVDTEADSGVSWEGEGADELPTDGSDMVSRAMRHVAEREQAAGRCGPLPPVRTHGVNRIPLERGLGSSSAAAVAGAYAARAVLGLDRADPSVVFAEAAEMEGHPDNAAPAVYGGFTVFASGSGVVRRFDPHPDLRPVVLVPERLRLSTEAARRVLPPHVSRHDAVFNIGHAALVVAGLTLDPGLLLVALHDRLHEDLRLGLVPEAKELLERLRRDGLAVCVSGAGPTLLVFESPGRVVPDPVPGWRVLRPGIRAAGAEVEVL